MVASLSIDGPCGYGATDYSHALTAYINPSGGFVTIVFSLSDPASRDGAKALSGRRSRYHGAAGGGLQDAESRTEG